MLVNNFVKFNVLRTVIDVESCLEKLDFQPIKAWLKDNIWSKGSTLSTQELMIQATGEPLDPKFFKEHLIRRYLD